MESKVMRTVGEWSAFANIDFFFEPEVEKANIRISFDPNDGSWSFVGTENTSIDKTKPTMNLGWLNGDTDTLSNDEHGVIMHEFGHVIGLLHEHQSPLRGDKITLKEAGSYYYLSRHVTSHAPPAKPSSIFIVPVKDGPRKRFKTK